VDENLGWLKDTHPYKFEFVKGDVWDYRLLNNTMQGADAIFHFAAQVAVTTSIEYPLDDFLVNARGTFNVLEAARHQKKMPIVLFTSTNKVYGEIEEPIVEEATRYRFQNLLYSVSETCPLNFHSPYGCSKGAADQYVRDYYRIYGLPTIVFRMSCIYGPHQHGNTDQGWVSHFVQSAIENKPITIYGDGKQVRDLLHVTDLTELMIRACKNIDRTAGQIFNVGGGYWNTISVWSELQTALNTLKVGIPDVSFEDFRPGDQKVYISDIRKAEIVLNWEPTVSVFEGVRLMVNEKQERA
jgi:CDP-paratose 2-epimerase